MIPPLVGPSFVVATACGDQAIDSLRRRADAVPESLCQLASFEGFAVAYMANSHWVTAVDDLDVLVVVDGRIHGVGGSMDTAAQIVARRYRKHGDRFAVGLIGEFVAVVMDRVSRRLIVSRDPVGVRPFYQAAWSQNSLGATDIATLADTTQVDTRINESVAVEFLALGWESRGPTIYSGIDSLQPGMTSVCEGGAANRLFRHHSWTVAPNLDITWDDAVDQCREVMNVAVSDRLRADEPATCELSGGLDSSSVVGTMMQLGRPDVLAARLMFKGPHSNETTFSDAVIDHWGIDSVSVPPWIPTVEEERAMTNRFRRPAPAPNFSMFVSLFAATVELGRPTVLTGLGGDDAFVAQSLASRAISSVQLRQWDAVKGLGRSSIGDPQYAWSALGRPLLAMRARRFIGRSSRIRTFPGVSQLGRRVVPPWIRPEVAERTGLVDRLLMRPPSITGVAAIDERLSNPTSGYLACILEESAVLQDACFRRASHPFLDTRLIQAIYGLDPAWPTAKGGTRDVQIAAFSDRLPFSVAARTGKAEFSEVFFGSDLGRRFGAHDKDRLSSLIEETGWLNVEFEDQIEEGIGQGRASALLLHQRVRALSDLLEHRDR
jgi:asparagine synthetase B (glutamine-hydrolysing)